MQFHRMLAVPRLSGAACHPTSSSIVVLEEFVAMLRCGRNALQIQVDRVSSGFEAL